MKYIFRLMILLIKASIIFSMLYLYRLWHFAKHDSHRMHVSDFNCAYSNLMDKIFGRKRRFRTFILVITLLSVTTLQSCYTQGYGCKGNSKIMTRVRM